MNTIFEDRIDAGRRLAKKLTNYNNSGAIILAIPRGGVPVASMIAKQLNLEWNVTVVRKLPIPSNPEAGFGAVTPDGSVILNDAILHGLRLTKAQIDRVIEEQKQEAIRRAELYASGKPPSDLAGRVVIILDDGLASGYTMLAAIKSARSKMASKVIVASPVASRSAAAIIEQAADECVFEIVSSSVPFAVADFYLQWRDLTDDDVLALLKAEDRR
ncbi:MAG: phosphoribosyltransferase family protein [Armatimonadota bacterium]|nr:phosphoribosyltransferase [bacterium]